MTNDCCENIIELYKCDAPSKTTGCLSVEHTGKELRFTNETSPAVPSFRMSVDTRLTDPCNSICHPDALNFYQVKVRGYLECPTNVKFFAQSKEEYPQFLHSREPITDSGAFCLQFKFQARTKSTYVGFKFLDGQTKNYMRLEKFEVCPLDPNDIPVDDQVTLISQHDLPVIIKRPGKYQVIENLHFVKGTAIKILCSNVVLDLNHHTIQQCPPPNKCCPSSTPHYGSNKKCDTMHGEYNLDKCYRRSHQSRSANAPVANDQNSVVFENQPNTLTLDATDTDLDQLTYKIITKPSNGTLDLTDLQSGTVVYTPDPEFVGLDSFTWKATDDTTDSALVTYYLDVLPNDTGIQVNQTKKGPTTLKTCCDPLETLKNIIIKNGSLCNISGVPVRIINTEGPLVIENVKTTQTDGFAAYSFEGSTQAIVNQCQALNNRYAGFFTGSDANDRQSAYITFDDCTALNSQFGFLTGTATQQHHITFKNSTSSDNKPKFPQDLGNSAAGFFVTGQSHYFTTCVTDNTKDDIRPIMGISTVDSANIFIESCVCKNSFFGISDTNVSPSNIAISSCRLYYNKLGIFILNSAGFYTNNFAADGYSGILGIDLTNNPKPTYWENAKAANTPG